MSTCRLIESIYSNVGGFYYIKGPCTAIPEDSDIDEGSIISLFNDVYPDKTDIAVMSDTIHELNIRILYSIDKTTLADITRNHPSASLQYHLTDMIREIYRSGKDTIAVVNSGDFADIVVIKDGKLLSLNQKSTDTYELMYTIAKIWSDFGFKKGHGTIRLNGFKETNSFKDNLTQMTGEYTVCVL